MICDYNYKACHLQICLYMKILFPSGRYAHGPKTSYPKMVTSSTLNVVGKIIHPVLVDILIVNILPKIYHCCHVFSVNEKSGFLASSKV